MKNNRRKYLIILGVIIILIIVLVKCAQSGGSQEVMPIFEGFGLKTGRTHGEFIVSDGQCYLVEIGARGGGSFFSSDDSEFIFNAIL